MTITRAPSRSTDSAHEVREFAGCDFRRIDLPHMSLARALCPR